jgi:hypothetical protein
LQRKAIGENLSIRYGSGTTTRKSRSREIAFLIVVCPVEVVGIGLVAEAFIGHIPPYPMEVKVIAYGRAALGEFAGVEVEVYEEGISGI